ncbi:hypothetical protein ADL01_23980 [Streptomyces sp. NRRL WC-3618]|jgi:hypothetical protein|uniref:hypothetical protein n=1 Tax=unclassified Streptomyces TaxID=2593676 RepID=UPI0006ADC11A|nr:MULTISPECIES: hypothetical protein [unclassified Streptomyces]KOV68047.1 hypothetical protein ADL01_23980 [Streptomyces sp. NRRL WC-3618]MCX5294014.1 hypothetical protein [Streptomyces sp. NBC_00183]
MSLQVGTRLRGQNSTCEVIVVKSSDTPAVLMCAGAEMRPTAPDPTAPQVSDGPPIHLGKRYTDDDSGIEVLCTKAGIGPLTFGNSQLTQKAAKALPASD